MQRIIRKGIILTFLTALIMLLSAVTVFAQVDAVVAKTTDSSNNTTYYQYKYDDLSKSYVAYRKDASSAAAKIYADYIKRTTVAYKDSVKGYIDYQAVSYQYRLAAMSGTRFDMNNYIAALQKNPFPELTAKINTSLYFVSLEGNELVFSGTPKEKVAKPSSNRASGIVAKGDTIILTSTSGASIYYTTDGTDPKTSSSRVRYTSPVTLTETTTITAYAKKDDMEDSDNSTFTYQVVVAYSALLQSPLNYSEPVPGSATGTTKISALSNLPQGASKWQIKISDTAVEAPFIMNDVLSSTADYVKDTDITVSEGKHIILLAADASGRIKAYADITVSGSQIRPASLLAGQHYSNPVPGNAVGTTKITSLSNTGINGAARWMIKIQNEAFTVPGMNTKVDGAVSYAPNEDIQISAGQHLLLLAVNDRDQVKAFKDISINTEQVSVQNAAVLDAKYYIEPEAGWTANTTRISVLGEQPLGTLPEGATKWRIRIQSRAFDTPVINSIIADTRDYLEGTDISINEGEHLVLLATDDSLRIKAFRDFVIAEGQISKPAGELKYMTNYIASVPGSTVKSTKFASLSFAGIEGYEEGTSTWKWQVKVQGKQFAAPGLNSRLDASHIPYIADYTANTDIIAAAGQHLVLLAVDGSEGHEGEIKAYKDMVVSITQIKETEAIELAENTNYTQPEKGLSPGTTKIRTLTLLGIPDAQKWMIKVQDEGLGAGVKLALNSTYEGAVNYVQGSDIQVNLNQHIILLATDNSGRVKGFKDLAVADENTIKEPNALMLLQTTNYSSPEPHSEGGKTKFSFLWVADNSGATKWQIKVTEEMVGIISLNSRLDNLYDADYHVNEGIEVKAGQHVILLAVDDSGQIKAYKDITISSAQIKPYNAGTLVKNTNYSDPVPGFVPQTTKFEADKLNFFGINGPPSKWMVKIHNKKLADAPELGIPQIDAIYSGAQNYTAGTDISATPGQYIVLLATDAYGKVKAYAEVELLKEHIKGASAALLVQTTNYSIPVKGSKEGRTKIAELAFSNIPNYDPNTSMWRFKHIISQSSLGIPEYDAAIASYAPGKTAVAYQANDDISIAANEHLTLLAVDNEDKIKAYKDLTIASIQIKGKDAQQMTSQNYGTLSKGIGVGTAKLTGLSNFGLIGPPVKWMVKTQSAALTQSEVPELDSTPVGYVSYTDGTDINMGANRCIVLLAVDASNKIKAYASIAVTEDDIRKPSLVKAEVISGDMYEADIIRGGKTIEVTVYTQTEGCTAKWADDIATDLAKRSTLLDGFTPASEETEWKKVIAALKDEGQSALARSSDGKTIIIYLCEVPAYNIGSNQSITLTIPSGCTYLEKDGAVITEATPVTADNSFSISATVTAAVSGTVVSGTVDERDIVSGGKTIAISLINGTWVSDIATNKAVYDKLFAAFVSTAPAYETKGWKDTVFPKLTGADIVRNSSNKITIVLPQASDYNLIQANETISLVVPGEAIAGGKSAPAVGMPSFTIKRYVPAAAPAVVSASTTTDGSKIEVKFNKAMSSVIEEGNAGFTISVNSETVTITKAGLKQGDAATIQLALAASVNDGDTIKVSYQPGTLVAADKGIFEVLTDYNVTNMVAPKLLTAAAKTDGTAVELTFSEFMNETLPKAPAGFGVKVNGISNVVKALALKADDARVIILTLTTPVVNGQTITVSYTAGSVKAADNGILPSLTEQAVANNVPVPPPVVVSASTDVFGKEIRIGFNDEMASIDDPLKFKDSFTVKVKTDTESPASSNIVTGVQLDSENKNIMVLTVTDTIQIGNIVEISYAKDMLQIMSAREGILDSFADMKVVNKVENPAIVINVAANVPNGAYSTGTAIDVTVTFSSAVDVSGTPALILETGTVDQIASYIAGTGTNTLIFRYIVQAGDVSSDLNYKDTVSLIMNSGSIKNKGTAKNADAGLPAVNSTYSLSGMKDIAIDTAAPAIDNSTAVISKTGTTVNIEVAASETAKAYYAVLPDGSYAPSAVQIKAGTDKMGIALPYNKKGSTIIDAASGANKKGIATITGLQAGTVYDVYIAVEDLNGNLSGTKALNGITTEDTAASSAPGFVSGYPQASSITDTAADIKIKADKAGRAYILVLDAGSVKPSAAQVKAGVNAANITVGSNRTMSAEIAMNREKTVTVAGLLPASAYDIWVVCEDNEFPTELQPDAARITLNTNSIDLLAPSAYISDVTATNTAVNITVTSDESGKIYYAILPNGAAAPDTAQIKAGTDAAKAVLPANRKGSINIIRDKQATISISGLTASTKYDVYLAAEDTANPVNLQTSAVVRVIATASLPDITAPINAGGYPKIEAKDSTAELYVKTNETGKGYFVVLPAGYAMPSAAQVKAGTNAAGAAVAASMKGTVSTGANTETVIKISGLAMSASYDLYFVAEDGSVPVNLQAIPARVQFATSPLILSGVSADIAAGKITGTSTGMEYSTVPEYGTPSAWTACTNNTTSIAFEEGSVYVRDKANSNNFIIIPVKSAGSFNEILDVDQINRRINNLNSTHEYKVNSGSWISGENAAAFASTDIVWVRKKAAFDKLWSESCGVYFVVQLDLSKVDIDIAKGQIFYEGTRVTTSMLEYSQDNTNWYNCSPDRIVFSEGDIYVREGRHLANAVEAVSDLTRANISSTGISYDVSRGIIEGTSDDMEYSFDKAEWYDVSAGGTTRDVKFTQGELWIRIKAAASALASNEAKLGDIIGPVAAPALAADDASNTISNLAEKVNGLPKYEYKIGEGEWTPGDVVGDFRGNKTVKIRARATNTSLPGDEQIILFTAN